ncbi:hypothetical protein JCM11251_004388 [Rhodosporidiobolus azoricus]
MNNLPAHATKHLAELPYSLPNGTRVSLTQNDAQTDSTGRTVWLGAQVLSVYLYDLVGRPKRKQRVAELGSGTGLLCLSLAGQGFDVLATDLEVIVDSVLARNVRANEEEIRIPGGGEGKIETKVLDWFQPAEEWDWEETSLEPPFDMIVTADTVYEPALSQPLLQTLYGLARLSPSAPIYVALEARDPALVASFLTSASSDFSFKTSRVEHSRLKKLVEDQEGTLAWEDESDWEGVEVWKFKLSRGLKGGKVKNERATFPSVLGLLTRHITGLLMRDTTSAVVVRALQADVLVSIFDTAAAAFGYVEGTLSKETATGVAGFALSFAAAAAWILSSSSSVASGRFVYHSIPSLPCSEQYPT